VDILRSARPHLPSCGGYASFEGIVRDLNDGLPVSRLEYEAYEALAYAEMERILQTVATRFGAKFLEVVHRMGVVEVGEVAVFIQVLAAHRREAFGAAEHIIDELKRSVPIWKKEHYRDGQTAWTLCQHQGPHTHDT
jgi:adenylyltransferase/sulfurtransferase